MGSHEKCKFDATDDCGGYDTLDKLHWWQKACIYQVLVQSFQDTDGDGNGDLRGIMERLDYFVELGVDVVWISPIYESPMCDMGYVLMVVLWSFADSHSYDIGDYRKVNPIFGTMEDFELLVREAHGRGLKIVLDIALNHTASTASLSVIHLSTDGLMMEA